MCYRDDQFYIKYLERYRNTPIPNDSNKYVSKEFILKDINTVFSMLNKKKIVNQTKIAFEHVVRIQDNLLNIFVQSV